MSTALRVLAGLLYAGAGVWGLILIVPVIYHWGGIILVIATILFAPIALLIIPWFNAIAHGDWFLVILNYATPIICGVLFVLAARLEPGRG